MDRATRILIVEDNAADAELMSRELQTIGVPVTTRLVANVAELRQALQDFAPDVILSDHALPSFSGRDVVRIALAASAHTPVIIVTGTLDDETAVEYVKAGASDYVLKRNLLRLGPAVRRALELKRTQEQQRRADLERARSEQRFRKLVEYSRDVIMLVDATGRIVYCSHSLHPSLGYAAGELAGRSAFEIVHRDDAPLAQRLLRDVSTGAATPPVELRVRHKDGSWRLLEVTAVNHLDDESVAAIVVTYHDITARRGAEEGLRQATDHLRALIAASPLAIYSLNPDGTVRTWNVAAERMFGWTADEVIGRPIPTVSEGKRQGEQAELLQRTLGGELLDGVELVRQKKDGKAITIRLYAAPLHDGAGRATSVIVLATDVTALLRLEAQYRQAQKMDSVGRLAGGVAHDFNNLLTIILGEAEMALTELPSDHAVAPALSEVVKAAERAADLTRQLLSFSRQQVIEPTVFRLSGVVADIEKMLRRLIGEDITLTARLAADTGSVRADRGQIEQVLVNLAVNARDAMAQGGILTIETTNVSLDESYGNRYPDVLPGDYVLMAVSDSGAGMSNDVVGQIFEPFFTTKAPGRGTGLGLATCYGIVKQAGGHIAVYSEVGIGTTMRVYLPRVSEQDQTPVRARATPVPRGGETILLVEDQPELREVAVRMLSAQGYRVIAAATGEEALRLLKKERAAVHLLLADVVLPGMRGGTLAEQARVLHPGLKVLFASGYAGDVVAHRQLTSSGIPLLQKPFTAKLLAQKVREVLES